MKTSTITGNAEHFRQKEIEKGEQTFTFGCNVLHHKVDGVDTHLMKCLMKIYHCLSSQHAPPKGDVISKLINASSKHAYCSR